MNLKEGRPPIMTLPIRFISSDNICRTHADWHLNRVCWPWWGLGICTESEYVSSFCGAG
ncbi:hypothetical protein BDU57DRAFT_303509 [Ampelomyces quisqualis]|uniref:Uncharacterized protein n=1 Tax=Ampelomyces quisqualis TaxID=50730 RepID=A0A6A5QHB5_AMPQU|nr:hypothetical protein BDU57DRAFT_303509 [Ampelomyces quisqualis]